MLGFVKILFVNSASSDFEGDELNSLKNELDPCFFAPRSDYIVYTYNVNINVFIARPLSIPMPVDRNNYV